LLDYGLAAIKRFERDHLAVLYLYKCRVVGLDEAAYAGKNGVAALGLLLIL
jgi:hypothetical protein